LERTDLVFSALGDATRRELLAVLARSSPRTATQLVGDFMITRQGILKHLDVLAQAGLVQVQPKGREKRYSLSPRPLEGVNEWIEGINARWQERMARLKDLVESDEPL
jgi:DNA-binding transcriptional ArsR family regulator